MCNSGPGCLWLGPCEWMDFKDGLFCLWADLPGWPHNCAEWEHIGFIKDTLLHTTLSAEMLGAENWHCQQKPVPLICFSATHADIEHIYRKPNARCFPVFFCLFSPFLPVVRQSLLQNLPDPLASLMHPDFSSQKSTQPLCSNPASTRISDWPVGGCGFLSSRLTRPLAIALPSIFVCSNLWSHYSNLHPILHLRKNTGIYCTFCTYAYVIRKAVVSIKMNRDYFI